MRRFGGWVVLLCMLSMLTFNVSAQESLALDDAVRLAREQSPAAKALRAQLAVAESEVDLAGVYPNPTVSYSGYGRATGNANAINGTQHQAWIDIPLLIAGQHNARRDVAEADVIVAQADLDAALLALEVETRSAFTALLAAQDRVSGMQGALVDLRRVLTLVEARAQAGAQSRYDGERMALEVARLESDLTVALAEQRAAATRLGAAIGRPSTTPTAAGTLAANDHHASAVDELPAVRAARARVTSANLDVERAKAERIPEITLGLGAYVTTDGDSTSAYAALSVPLPIFNTGSAAVSRAQAASDAAAAEQAAVEQQIQARITAALGLRTARRQALEAFDSATQARVVGLLQSAEDSYRLGVSPIFELLDAFRTRVDLVLARIELATAVAEADIDLIAIAAAPLVP